MRHALKDHGRLRGSYVMTVRDAVTGAVLKTIKRTNLIVNATGYGYDLITRGLAGDATYGTTIDSAAIGTGSAAPTAADTGLGASVLAGISLADTDFSVAGQVVLSFFIADGQLANGTYNEFGIFASGRLFARSILSPALTKGTNQNITIEYTLTFS